jgi:NADH dehydrogenase [ubiquinone] 1 alpha subcomplex assembly factor 7
MTPLAEILINQIRASGPMRLSDYMEQCLLHPVHGYYTSQQPFGASGDFTTAPEISQMFGELLGLCLAQHWLDAGRPAAFTLAELGPGRGTLMADVLRATKGIAGFHSSANIVLLEASPAMRAAQRARLEGYPVTWIDQIGALAQAPLYLLANEFFDALPVRQFTRDSEGWRETVIGLTIDSLTLGLTAVANFGFLQHRLADTKPGDIIEICPAAEPVMREIDVRIANCGGLALIFDYGGWRSHGDTFQAMYKHSFVSPVDQPGQVDLTAHVDFEALTNAARQSVSKYAPMGKVLTDLGIHIRAQHLRAGLQDDARAAHDAATERLTSPTAMGELFKALAIFRAGGPTPSGFA